jgi:hypothetical protein
MSANGTPWTRTFGQLRVRQPTYYERQVSLPDPVVTFPDLWTFLHRAICHSALRPLFLFLMGAQTS